MFQPGVIMTLNLPRGEYIYCNVDSKMINKYESYYFKFLYAGFKN